MQPSCCNVIFSSSISSLWFSSTSGAFQHLFRHGNGAGLLVPASDSAVMPSQRTHLVIVLVSLAQHRTVSFCAFISSLCIRFINFMHISRSCPVAFGSCFSALVLNELSLLGILQSFS